MKQIPFLNAASKVFSSHLFDGCDLEQRGVNKGGNMALLLGNKEKVQRPWFPVFTRSRHDKYFPVERQKKYVSEMYEEIFKKNTNQSISVPLMDCFGQEIFPCSFLAEI